jgi:hypothetical protein
MELADGQSNKFKLLTDSVEYCRMLVPSLHVKFWFFLIGERYMSYSFILENKNKNYFG